MIVELEEQLKEKEIKIDVTEKARDYIGEQGYDETYGARPLRRVIQNLIEDKLSDFILDGTVNEGDNLLIDFDGSDILVKVLDRVVIEDLLETEVEEQGTVV